LWHGLVVPWSVVDHRQGRDRSSLDFGLTGDAMAWSLLWLHQNEEDAPSVLIEAIGDRLDGEARLFVVESVRWQ
jgi:hypothetical protein